MAVVKPNKEYGDSTALRRLAVGGTKQGNEDLVPRTRQPVGRPGQGPAYRGAPQAGAPTAAGTPSPYEPLYRDFGRAARTATVAQGLGTGELLGPWLRSYQVLAVQDAEEKAYLVRDNTPFLEE